MGCWRISTGTKASFRAGQGESLFVRLEVAVERQAGETTWAWAYVFNRTVDGLPRIASGDYASHVPSAVEP
jgi:gamma-glutamylcyclotransferase (GGCT)/AIG2-like uncharacterized protein YtfP